jgi:hypothetical protein
MWTTSSARILGRNECQDHGNRLAEVSEAAHQDVDEREKRADPE